MFGFRYLKAAPTDYILYYRSGRLRREGSGLMLFYYSPISTLASVPIGSQDVPFIFEEVSSDFQDVSVQGELTYRIVEPKRIAALLDFSIDHRGVYRSEDPYKLSERLVHSVQILTRAFTQRFTLKELLVSAAGLVEELRQQLVESEVVKMLGVEILSLSILAVKPNPEMAKALQAEARELLLLAADEAIFRRRNAAVELERQIKENELNTEIAVEQKRRQVRETQMQADIAVEQQRTQLVDEKIANERKEAEGRGEALRAMLEPVKSVDWRTLMALSSGQLDGKQLIAMAFRDLAENAERIGNLNLSPDLLASLLDVPSRQRK